MFILEKTEVIPLPTSDAKLSIYKCNESAFRIIFVKIPGPLVSTSIVVPTTTTNDMGLPHTLEHLVFCGSKSLPFRGYLDNLSTRCLSTGTNAYTTDDHTCYEITTAGQEGMKNIFPVFLDHVLNPTLLPSQFITEVYHLDKHGKHQGVVYCEMASRENSEADMLDLNMRKLIYQNETTYSNECGGLTKDIKNLTNEDIIAYHKQFYHLENVTAIICGDVDCVDFIDSLEEHNESSGLFEDTHLIPEPAILKTVNVHASDWSYPDANLTSNSVEFPSVDEDVGSIAYGFRGPSSEDAKTIYALEIIFRFMNDNPSSLFPQRFIEREDPYAADVDFEVKAFVDSPIVLTFYGVPYFSGGDDEDEEMQSQSEDEESEEENAMDDDAEMDEEEEEGPMSRKDLYHPGVYFKLFRDTIQEFLASPISKADIQKTILRHRRKIQESLEESPHEMIASNIVPDIIRHSLASKSALGDTKKHGGSPMIGTRLKCGEILDDLEKEDVKYWKNIVQNYLFDKPICEIKMIPSKQLERSQTKERALDENLTLEKLTKEQLVQIGERVEEAINENKVNIPKDILENMPSIPDVSKLSLLEYEMENIVYKENRDTLFSGVQIVKTNAALVHFGIGFGIKNLPENLRSYLVLFQELMFQSGIKIPGNNGLSMDYKEVSRYVSELFISQECGVGYLSQVMTFFTTADPKEWERVIRFTFQVFLFTVFEKERIVTIAKNLITNIVDIKRDGHSVLSAVQSRVSLSKEQSQKEGSNEFHISIFKQEKFLAQVLKDCENDPEKVINNLGLIRDHIISQSLNDNTPSFMRIGVPLKFSINQSKKSSMSDLSNDLLRIWNGELQKLSPEIQKRKRKDYKYLGSPFPYPRSSFQRDHMDLKFSENIMVSVGGLQTYYLSQSVECDLLITPKHPDYFPTLLLSEILTRAEGPLYTGIRGQGFAYGANMYCYLWAGQLSFELYQSSEPQKALQVFYDLLEKLGIDFDVLCSDYEIETAQASVAYRWAADSSTACTIMSTALRSSLQGFTDLDDCFGFVNVMYQVKRSDLKRVFEKYFRKFLGNEKNTVVVTPMGKMEDATKSFLDYNLEFKSYQLKDFDI